MPDLARDATATSAPADTLVNIVRGYRAAQALSAAATLGIADLLADGPRSVDDLAEATSTHAASLYRLLRALASVGVFAEDDERRFHLTPLAEPLRTSVPGSVRGLVRLLGDPALFEPWGQLLYSIRTGQPAFDHLHGMGLYSYLAQHPETAAVFHAGMAATGRHQAVVESYDFAEASVVVDVGGGDGALLVTILRAHPTLRGVLFDRPEIVASARERLEREDLAERCQVVGGSFFDSVPEGGDLYVVSDVVHNWNDDEATTILVNCRRAMAEDHRLLVIQQVVPPGNAPSLSKLDDLNMLAVLGGRERTADEHRAVLAAAGFTLTRIIPTRASYDIIEAAPLRSVES